MNPAPLPYEIDLHRPPAPLQPRVPLWVVSAVILAVFAVTGIVESSILQSFTSVSLPVLDVLVTVITISEIYAFWYVILRLTGAGITLGVPFLLLPFVVLTFRWVNKEGSRTADPEEVSARRNLRRGAIPRREYERIIAYRHYVHGEISQSEYHAILAFLDKRFPGETTGAHP